MSKEQSVVLNKIKNAIDDFSMLKDFERVLVGFSGGKDSVALLCALKALSPIYKTEIYAFHVHHGIRGDEAERDLEFCKSFCAENQISFDHTRVNAPLYAEQNGIGLEEAARILRYRAFDEYARQKGIQRIATAHTSSDSLETVIFNLARGTSLEGLKGIPPVRDNIIRPLIYCTTDEIYEFVGQQGLSYVFDSTNDDTDYTRNYIRQKIVPLLKDINPEVENAVTRTCHTARRDMSFLASCVGETGQTADTGRLLSLHDAILSRYLVSMYERAAGGKSTLGFEHIESMIDLLRGGRIEGRKHISLPGRITFVATNERVYFESEESRAEKAKHPYEKELRYGLNRFDEQGFAVFVCKSENEFDPYFYKNVYKMSIHTAVKRSAVTDRIIVRCRKDGDVYRCGNMTKKVKKMMNEKKIALEKRDILPMLCDGEGIFWAPHLPLRDGMKMTDEGDALHFYYLEEG